MKTKQEKIEELKREAYAYSLNAKSYQEMSEEIKQVEANYKKHTIRKEELEGQLAKLDLTNPTEDTIHQKRILEIQIEAHTASQKAFASTIEAYGILLDLNKPGFEKYCEILNKIKKLQEPTIVDKAKALLAKATTKKKQADTSANEEQSTSETPEETSTTPNIDEPVQEEPGE